LPELSSEKQAMRFDFPLLMAAAGNASLAEIARIDRTDDGAVDVTDIDPRRTKGRFLLLVL
jgi:hypothetical protein